MTENWKRFYERSQERGPRPLLTEALGFVKKKERALELGAGTLNEAKILIQNGFKEVVAVDKNEQAFRGRDSTGISLVVVSIEDFDYEKEAYDLISAQYSLSFLPKNTLLKVMEEIKMALATEGIFCGNLFGNHDSWNGRENMSFFSTEETKEQLEGLELIKFQEEERDAATVLGNQKHWHVFNFIAKKS